MDVFLVPVSDRRHELYCEVAEPLEPGGAPAGPSTSWWRRQVDRFRTTLQEAEQERLRRERGEATDSRGIGRWIIRKIAEAIAEQRLLWHLRKTTAARLIHPVEMTGESAMALLRQLVGADYAKHRRWLVIDAVIAAITGPLFFFVPGPNVVSWYFAFRAIGHFFSMRGARQGLRGVTWEAKGSSDLTAIRQALTLAPEARREAVERLATSLGLQHLSGFIERVAARS
jgi:hypothetical protein